MQLFLQSEPPATLLATPALAVEIINNGGFEAGPGLFGWFRTNRNIPSGGSAGWFPQFGTVAPVNPLPVPPPPGGTTAAMTGERATGDTRILFQSFVVPVGVTSATLSYQQFINNYLGVFISPGTLDFGQQARVDILIGNPSNIFSVLAVDVLDNIYQTLPGDPISTGGYDLISTDLTALLQAHEGESLVLRFAESDLSAFFNYGIDDVSLSVTIGVAVPEPGSPRVAGLGRC
jgi:hypothetical protein